MPRKVRLIGSIVLAYGAAVSLIVGLFWLPNMPREPVHGEARPVHMQPAAKPARSISGTPTRIVIAAADIDLRVDKGGYNETTGTWTLSPTHAQFATETMPANNAKGMTFIYGHGTDAVFGKIGKNPPPLGTKAKLYTSNGHVFTYVLQEVRDFEPSDTSVFAKATSGAPRLVVQTCTGMFDQWRTMFTFSLEKSTRS